MPRHASGATTTRKSVLQRRPRWRRDLEDNATLRDPIPLSDPLVAADGTMARTSDTALIHGELVTEPDHELPMRRSESTTVPKIVAIHLHNGVPQREGHRLNADFLESCKFRRFDSSRMRPSYLQLLFHLGRMFGPGLTRVQFRQIVRQCAACENFIFAERRDGHKCDATALETQAQDFDFVTAFASPHEHAGIKLMDLQRIFTLCEECEHVCLEGGRNAHQCPARAHPDGDIWVV